MAKKLTKKPKHKPGKPKSGEKRITAADHPRIAELFAQGYSQQDIADHMGVGRRTIRDALNSHILPTYRRQTTHAIEQELLKIDYMEKIAWRLFNGDGPAETTATTETISNDSEDAKKLIAKLEAEGNGTKVDRLLTKRKLTKNYKPHQKAWLEVAMWCIDTRNKINGNYAAKKVQIEQEEFRVAGLTPDQVNREMVLRLKQKLEERQAYEQSMRVIDHKPAEEL